MKYLLLIVLLALVFFMLGVKRARPPASKNDGSGAASRANKTKGAQHMVPCAQCGVHLPRDEALPGLGGVFCGPAHRAAFERAQQAEAAERTGRGPQP